MANAPIAVVPDYIKGVVEDLDLQISPVLAMFSRLILATSKDDIAEIASLHHVPSKMADTASRILFQ